MLLKSLQKIIDPLKYAKKMGMRVGKGVSLAGKQGVSFGSEPYLITIDDNVRISGNVKFFTHDGGTWAFRDKEEYKEVFKFGSIYIGKHTFIGNGVIILPGVSVGERCVIGAGSVVTKDIPDNCVVAGVPAKIISTTNEYAEKVKKRFLLEKHDLKKYKANKKKYLIEKYL